MTVRRSQLAGVVMAAVLVAPSCATPYQKVAASLGEVRVRVKVVEEPVVVWLDGQRLGDALYTGLGESVSGVVLPFELELRPNPTSVPSVELAAGPAAVWRTGKRTVVLEWPLTVVVRNEGGQAVLEEELPCFDHGRIDLDILIPSEYPEAPVRISETLERSTLPEWTDLQRAYEALARWCGGRVVERLAEAAN